MRWLINYIRSCFCKHDWEIIFNGEVTNNWGGHYHNKIYRCKKCGYSKQYKSI